MNTYVVISIAQSSLNDFAGLLDECREIRGCKDSLLLFIRQIQVNTLSMMSRARLTADLSDEQKQAIFAAPDFSAFIEESTRIWTPKALSMPTV
jgi:hypothetical protein